jgi:ketosteroid isomerase-like protein
MLRGICIGLVSSVVIALGIDVANATAQSRTNDEAAITAIEKEMAAAQTVDGVVRSWDENVVWYDLMPAEVHGSKAARERFDEQFKGVTNLRTKILRMSVRTEANMGYAYSTQEFISDVPKGGPGLDFIFRETDLFIKKAGKWRLVHQHISVPVDFATGKAVFSNVDPLTHPDGK